MRARRWMATGRVCLSGAGLGMGVSCGIINHKPASHPAGLHHNHPPARPPPPPATKHSLRAPPPLPLTGALFLVRWRLQGAALRAKGSVQGQTVPGALPTPANSSWQAWALHGRAPRARGWWRLKKSVWDLIDPQPGGPRAQLRGGLNKHCQNG